MYNMSEKIENLHKRKHEKHAHTPTLEQLTTHIVHMQKKKKKKNKNGWNAHIKISMNRTMHCLYKCYTNKKLLRDQQQQLHLLQKMVQEKDSHFTREHMTCLHKQISNLGLQINKLKQNIQSKFTQQDNSQVRNKVHKREQCNTTAIAN